MDFEVRNEHTESKIDAKIIDFLKQTHTDIEHDTISTVCTNSTISLPRRLKSVADDLAKSGCSTVLLYSCYSIGKWCKIVHSQ